MTKKREVWGILGGMGPFASAEFLNSIYDEAIADREQEAPSVILVSDPTVPDRTRCLLSGRQDLLLDRLSAGIEQLLLLGATRIVICCVTIHLVVAKLPAIWQEKIVSLPDLILTAVSNRSAKHLMLCTTGTRKLRLFEQHPLWPHAQDKIVMLDEQDQHAMHNLLYEIKRQRWDWTQVQFVEGLMKKYGVRSYIAGCTEMHIFAKAHEQSCGRDRREFCVDPLTDIVSMMQARKGMAVG